MIKWWGYMHTNGKVQIKRYFSKLDLDEAHESPFCHLISDVVEANDRNEAETLIRKELGKLHDNHILP